MKLEQQYKHIHTRFDQSRTKAAKLQTIERRQARRVKSEYWLEL